MDALFTGLISGGAIAAPVGPLGLLCLRRTLAGGFWLGFASGVGVACVDGAYALLALTALDVVKLFVAHAGYTLQVAGGIALVALGVRAGWSARAAPHPAEARRGSSVAGAFASTVALTIVNPATIVSFAAIVAASDFDFSGTHGNLLFVIGVAVGSAGWWFVLCGTAARLRHAMSPSVMRAIDYASAAGFIAWGIASIVRR